MSKKKLDTHFYQSPIYEKCDVDEVCENGFIDRRYLNRKLADDLIFQAMQKKMRDVDGGVQLMESKVIQGVASTPYGTISTENGKTVISLGCLNVNPPRTEILPDYKPAFDVFVWYTVTYANDPEADFINVAVANPLIPHSAKERPASTDSVDEVMEKAGAILFNPSYTIAEARSEDTYVPLVYEDKPLMDRLMDQRIIGRRFIFTSRTNYVFHWTKRYKVAALEFNPFSPMAYPYIKTFVDDGRVIRGTYRWGRRERTFYFSRESKKHRFHYDIWGNMFGYRNYYLSMFDLVANFDLRELLLFSDPPQKMSFFPRFVVEGYFPGRFYLSTDKGDPVERLKDREGEEQLYFSQISSYRRPQQEGWDYIRTYHSNTPVLIRSKGVEYLDITPLYELRYYNQSRWEMYIAERKTGKTIVTLMYTDKKEKHKQTDPRLFVQYSMKTSTFSVFVLEKSASSFEKASSVGMEFFSYSPGCFFFSTPRNMDGCLLRNPSMVNFTDYMRIMKEETVTSSLESMMPSYTGDGRVEEFLTPEELLRIQGQFGYDTVEEHTQEQLLVHNDF